MRRSGSTTRSARRTRTAALLATAAVAAGVAGTAPGGTATAASAGSARAAGHSAGYALRAMGYGTRVIGGQVPASSRDTAFSRIGCSTVTGRHRENSVVTAAPAAGMSVDGVKTETWTARAHGGVHSFTRSYVAKASLSQPGLGGIELTGITSLAHAWHNRTGFHAETTSTLGGMTVAGVPVPAQSLPGPGDPVTIPGVATIAVGHTARREGRHASAAIGDALDISLIPSGTRVRVAHAIAQVMDGVKHGRFGGFSAATQVTALDGALTSGRNPLSTMPCQGTGGQLRSKALAHLDLGGQVVVDGLGSQQRGRQLAHRSVAMERGTVAAVNIGNGQLLIKSIAGQANVTRRAGGKLTSNARGTTVGTIIANGQQQHFPDTGVLEVPGVARLERNVVHRTRQGISVVALRVTLLDGSGVADLGVANAYFRR